VLIDELTNRSVRGLETGENELTNRTVQFKADANVIKDELTHRLVHLSLDSRDTDELTRRSVHRLQIERDIDELTHRSVHMLQITGVHMNLLTGQFIDYR
jgi:hypothetical protein